MISAAASMIRNITPISDQHEQERVADSGIAADQRATARSRAAL